MMPGDKQADSPALERIRAGETIHLGGQVWLDADGLSVGGEQIPLNTMSYEHLAH